MEALGDKNTARSMARKAKVPVVPGSAGLIDDDDEAVRVGPRDRLSRADQGDGRRRRQGNARRRQRPGPEDRPPAGPDRGPGRVRQRRRLSREVHRAAAARRGADHRRPSRQRLPPLRARVQHAAAASKADRGKPRPAPAARKAHGHVRSRRAADHAKRATPTPAPSSSSSIKPTTSTSSRSTPASRSSIP